jgi:hypothetical protein
MSDDTYPRLIDANTLAHVLRVSPGAITRMVATGEIVAYRAGKVALRFNLDETLARLRIDPHEKQRAEGGAA